MQKFVRYMSKRTRFHKRGLSGILRISIDRLFSILITLLQTARGYINGEDLPNIPPVKSGLTSVRISSTQSGNLFGSLVADELIRMMIANISTIQGCSPQEIDELKAKQGVGFLPKLYVEYLAVLGRKAGNLDVGSDCFYPHLLRLKEWAQELLEENNCPLRLPDDAFVCLMHQGYQFLYFLTDDNNEDPPVFYYMEGHDYQSEMPIRHMEHLSEFLSYFIVDVRNKTAQENFLSRWKSAVGLTE